MVMTHDHLDCEAVIARLFAFLDGEIADAERADIERHLERCRDCFTRAEFEQRLRAKLGETHWVAAPDQLRKRVRAMIARF
jgi:anti-sigma factor (TIGR02949 family)